MPALVNRSVGSLAGTSDDECTCLCPFCTKKSRNFLRISEPVSMRFNSKRGITADACHEPKGMGAPFLASFARSGDFWPSAANKIQRAREAVILRAPCDESG